LVSKAHKLNSKFDESELKALGAQVFGIRKTQPSLPTLLNFDEKGMLSKENVCSRFLIGYTTLTMFSEDFWNFAWEFL